MMNFFDGRQDTRHVVATLHRGQLLCAVVINPDKTFQEIVFDDLDGGYDYRTANPEYDATPEEHFLYRVFRDQFLTGDKIKIVSGRKMLNETKIFKKEFLHQVFKWGDVVARIPYVMFTDNTCVQKCHCQLVS